MTTTAPTRSPSPTHRRIPPQDLEAEESLLGAMLLSKDAIAACIEIVASADFYKPAHSHVFDAICGLYARNEPADPVTVADELRRGDLLDLVGGAGTLIALQAATPATGNAGRYARIVEELALLRRMISVGSEITELSYQLPSDVTAALDRAETLLFNVGQRRVSDTTRSIDELMAGTLERLEALYNRGDEITGVPTGFHDLDHQLGGLQPSNLIVLGARPGHGKTSLALNLATTAAADAHRPVLFFSLEMSAEEINSRLLCAEARVDSVRMRSGKLHDADWPRLAAAMGRLQGSPLHIDDNPMVTVMDIRAKARRLRTQLGDLGLIIVDYIQLMTGRANAETRQVEVSEISRGLKLLARELNCPVLALSQLSRNLEQRADKRPMLSDLRESGALEQDSDVVMFLYRDELYPDDSPDKGVGEVIVAKHRSGPTGTCKLAFLDSYTKFANMARV
jgi:replicative DNA helicase